jgi:hypothetical protein
MREELDPEIRKSLDKYYLAKKGIIAITLLNPRIGESLTDIVDRLERREFLREERGEVREKESISI